MKVYITFGDRFRRETHPLLPNAHPDGWYEMDSPDGLARVNVNNMIYRILGEDWSNAYMDDEFDPSFYPLGKLGDLA